MSEQDQPLPVTERIRGVRTIRDLRAILPQSFTDGFGGGAVGEKKALRVLEQLCVMAHTVGAAHNFPGSRLKGMGSRMSEETFAALITPNLEGNSRTLDLATPEENIRIINLCLEAGIIERRQPNPKDRFDDPDNVYLLSESMGRALKRIFKP